MAGIALARLRPEFCVEHDSYLDRRLGNRVAQEDMKLFTALENIEREIVYLEEYQKHAPLNHRDADTLRRLRHEKAVIVAQEAVERFDKEHGYENR